jgi:hypothetical protein
MKIIRTQNPFKLVVRFAAGTVLAVGLSASLSRLFCGAPTLPHPHVGHDFIIVSPPKTPARFLLHQLLPHRSISKLRNDPELSDLDSWSIEIEPGTAHVRWHQRGDHP